MKGDSPTILFLHIPKTAGVSLMRILWGRYGLWPPNRWFHFARVFGDSGQGDHRARLDRIAALDERQRRQVKAFLGHVGYGAHEFLHQPVFQFTVIRDPVARCISTLKYLPIQGLSPPGRSIEELALSDEHPSEKFYLDNAHVRYLAGENGNPYDGPVGTVTQQMLDTAIERIGTIDAVGLTERLDESIALLGAKLGWKFNLALQLNRTKKQPASQSEGGASNEAPLSERAQQRLEDLNQLDQQLHRAAIERFESDIAEQGAEFPSRLERLKLRTQRYSGAIERLDNLRRSIIRKRS